MDRRTFLASSALVAGGRIAPACAALQDYSDYTQDPRPDVPEGTCTAGALDGPIFERPAMVAGPGNDSITILQPVERAASGFLEYAIDDGPWQRVDALQAGMRPFAEHVLKFQLPPLPPCKAIRYRTTATTIGWVKTKQFYHGTLVQGPPQTTEPQTFQTLAPNAVSTQFVVWNDTHENNETLDALRKLTAERTPDFLVWNGDQSNDCHFERDMPEQFICPTRSAIADRWPLAYVRGNHECRGPAAWSLKDFTGSPLDRFYYGFRSGPLAAIVLDTGEDKPDDSPYYGGLAAFTQMQTEQARWLQAVVQEEWFRSAPHKILFCHIPLWFNQPRIPNNSFDGHKICRELWTKTLVDAGVKLVISGHTHDFLWMPANESQPISQLVGGGPKPQHATIITGHANATDLKLQMHTLDGTCVAAVTIPA
ncbi:MAG: metallophosphoesterase [Pirellulaceae bacterium]